MASAAPASGGGEETSPAWLEAGGDDEEALSQAFLMGVPAVGEPIPVEGIAEDYMENEQFRHSAAALGSLLRYRCYRRIRRDGSCFYRAWLFGVAQHLSQAGVELPHAEVAPIAGPEPATAAAGHGSSSASGGSVSSASTHDHTSPYAIEPMVAVVKTAQETYQRLIALASGSLDRFDARLGIDPSIAKDFVDSFNRVLSAIPGSTVDAATAAVRDDIESQFAIAFLRYLTSTGAEELSGVIEPVVAALGSRSVAEYRHKAIEATKWEADHVAIACLAALTGIPVTIVSLSPSKTPSVATFPAGADPTSCAVHLFFRPGHYDLLEPGPDTPRALASI